MKKICILFILISLELNNCRLHRHTYDVFGKHQIFIESHRGVNREIFQNTKEAFQRAIDYDIDAIETDVWLTKDNVLVLVHGGDQGNLDGYYDHPGIVTELTWEELQTYRTIKDNLQMPRLDATMEQLKDKAFLNLEIKDHRVTDVWPKLLELVEKYDFFDQICFSSFDHNYYPEIEKYNSEHDKKIVFGFLYEANEQDKFDFTKKGHQLHIYYSDATKEICDKAHENGMAVMVWFGMKSVENTEVYRDLYEKDVDVICSNVPLLAKLYRNNYYN